MPAGPSAPVELGAQPLAMVGVGRGEQGLGALSGGASAQVGDAVLGDDELDEGRGTVTSPLSMTGTMRDRPLPGDDASAADPSAVSSWPSSQPARAPRTGWAICEAYMRAARTGRNPREAH
jgi:hypothetical protein